MIAQWSDKIRVTYCCEDMFKLAQVGQVKINWGEGEQPPHVWILNLTPMRIKYCPYCGDFIQVLNQKESG